MNNKGQIVCVGLGPGDPELMSVKADRMLRNARHVAFFRKRGHPGKARQLVNGMLHAEVTEYPMEYPLTTEIPHNDPRYIAQLSDFYATWQAKLTELGFEVVANTPEQFAVFQAKENSRWKQLIEARKITAD